MEYISLILGFFAVMVGVRGNTWDKKKTSIKKITASGWAAIAIALLSALIAGHGIYERNKARAIIQKHTRLYVKAAMNDVLRPFWQLHDSYAMSRGKLNTTIRNSVRGSRNNFDSQRGRSPIIGLKESGFIEYLQKEDLTNVKAKALTEKKERLKFFCYASKSMDKGFKRIRELLKVFQDELEVPIRSALLTIIDPDGFAEAVITRKDLSKPAATMLSQQPDQKEYKVFIDACINVSERLPDEKD